MRVLMLSWEYPPHVVGGLGRHVAELVPELGARGIDVTVLTPWALGASAEEEPWPGVRIVRVGEALNGGSDLALVLQANHAFELAAQRLALRDGRFDVIHAHDWLVAEAGVALKHAWRTPLVATIHATERGRGRGALVGPHSPTINEIEWRLSYETWRIIVCSVFMAAQVQGYFDTPADKISVVENGVALRCDPFSSTAERREFRRRFAADDEQLVIYVGRIVYEKGIQVLLNAWPRICSRHGARLAIAGTGPYLSALRAQAEAMGSESKVSLLGFISDEDRDRLYRVADVAVFPSLYEPFGIVALEAFAAGCPVVTTNTGGLREVVRSHQTGIMVDPDSADSLVWGILHTLDNPEWARSRAENALRAVYERFTWPRIAGETASVYQRVLAEWRLSDWGVELAHHYGD